MCSFFFKDTENLWISRKDIMQVISDIVQSKSNFQPYIHLDYLILAKRLTHFKIPLVGGCSLGNNYRNITDLCVTTVLLAHDG